MDSEMAWRQRIPGTVDYNAHEAFAIQHWTNDCMDATKQMIAIMHAIKIPTVIHINGCRSKPGVQL
jgi:hypothetical protein